MKQKARPSASSVSLAMLALLLALSLAGCGVQESAMPTSSATALTGEGFAVAGDYAEIHALILSGVPASSQARPSSKADDDKATGTASTAAATDAADAADAAAAADTDGDGAGYAPESTSSKPPLVVSGITQESHTVKGGGSVYQGQDEGLKVYAGSEGGAELRSINLYDYTNVGGEVVGLFLYGKTLAVLFATNAGVLYPSTDYTLSAYAAPRSLVLFFDVTEPGDPSFVSAIGISGTPLAVLAQGGNLFVATSHPATPNVGTDGLWILNGREPSEVKGYASSLTLRADSPRAFVPGYFDDGEITPLLPSQLYVSAYGEHTSWTAVASFSLDTRSCVSLFALLNPGVVRPSATAIGAGGFAFAYEAEYEGLDALVVLSVPVVNAHTMPGLGSVSWSER
ncbi:MAG: beta-propeller domain-containing protein [Coriobacteriales bacterium]|jgi:hypothetical protein|nr:beta-propeller domain-containing protein [Coriobacteriales bacterium]